MTVEQLMDVLDNMRREGYANSKVVVTVGNDETANGKEANKLYVGTVMRSKEDGNYYTCYDPVWVDANAFYNPEVAIVINSGS